MSRSNQRVTIDLPAELFERFVAALDSQGLHVIEYVKAGSFRYQVATAPPATAIARGEVSMPAGFVPDFLRPEPSLRDHHEFNR